MQKLFLVAFLTIGTLSGAFSQVSNSGTFEMPVGNFTLERILDMFNIQDSIPIKEFLNDTIYIKKLNPLENFPYPILGNTNLNFNQDNLLIIQKPTTVYSLRIAKPTGNYTLQISKPDATQKYSLLIKSFDTNYFD